MLNVAEITTVLNAEFNSLQFARDSFPMLTSWGVQDFSVTIHSLGCNYLTALGRYLGCWSASEYPVRASENQSSSSVRPDVVWWSKETSHAVLIGEFERFDPRLRQNLIEKARNLLKAHYEVGEMPRILLLMAWAMAGTDLSCLEEVRATGHNGFVDSDGRTFPGLRRDSSFIIASAIFGYANNIHRLLAIQV
jgi:hypothetical protein